jgi:hypothetical protein
MKLGNKKPLSILKLEKKALLIGSWKSEKLRTLIRK